METEEKEKEKTLIVSDNFVETYRYINVRNCVNNMNRLDRWELLLLIAMAVNNIPSSSYVLQHNLKEFINEVELIYNYLNDDSTQPTDIDLLYLVEKLDNDLDLSYVHDKNNNKLPAPIPEPEAIQMAREIKITEILD